MSYCPRRRRGRSCSGSTGTNGNERTCCPCVDTSLCLLPERTAMDVGGHVASVHRGAGRFCLNGRSDYALQGRYVLFMDTRGAILLLYSTCERKRIAPSRSRVGRALFLFGGGRSRHGHAAAGAGIGSGRDRSTACPDWERTITSTRSGRRGTTLRKGIPQPHLFLYGCPNSVHHISLQHRDSEFNQTPGGIFLYW